MRRGGAGSPRFACRVTSPCLRWKASERGKAGAGRDSLRSNVGAHPDRAVQGQGPPRERGHGRGLRGRRREAGPARGDQDPRAQAPGIRGVQDPLPSRGPRAGGHEPPEHRRGVLHRRARGPAVPGDGVPRRRGHRRLAQEARRAEPGRRGGGHPSGGDRAGGDAAGRGGPPRREALEPGGDLAGLREGDGLRAGQGAAGGPVDHGDGGVRRHARLPGAGAGDGQGGRRARRRVRARLLAVPHVLGPPAVSQGRPG